MSNKQVVINDIKTSNPISYNDNNIDIFNIDDSNLSRRQKRKLYKQRIKQNKKIAKNKTINKNYPQKTALAENVCIKTENLQKIIANKDKRFELIKNVNLEIYKGDFAMILGVSGSGKTTLLSLLSALDRPTAGNVNILGYNIACMKLNEMVKLREHFIGYVFQQYGLLKEVSVLENIIVTLPSREQNKILRVNKKYQRVKRKIVRYYDKLIPRCKHLMKKTNWLVNSYSLYDDSIVLYTNVYLSPEVLNAINVFRIMDFSNDLSSKLKKDIAIARDKLFNGFFAYEIMKKLEIDHLINHRIYALSGGQQQRVSICRAVVKRPKILFADEPTGAVDAKTAKIIMDIFKWLNLTLNTTIIIVTHNDKLIDLSNHIIVIDGGQVVSDTFNTPKTVNEIDFE